MHMLRWARFCEHTKAIENLYPIYQKRLRYAKCEFCMSVFQTAKAHMLLLAVVWIYMFMYTMQMIFYVPPAFLFAMSELYYSLRVVGRQIHSFFFV